MSLVERERFTDIIFKRKRAKKATGYSNVKIEKRAFVIGEKTIKFNSNDFVYALEVPRHPLRSELRNLEEAASRSQGGSDEENWVWDEGEDSFIRRLDRDLLIEHLV